MAIWGSRLRLSMDGQRKLNLSDRPRNHCNLPTAVVDDGRRQVTNRSTRKISYQRGMVQDLNKGGELVVEGGSAGRAARSLNQRWNDFAHLELYVRCMTVVGNV